MKKSKLKLSRQTIANLTFDRLVHVKGGTNEWNSGAEITFHEGCGGVPSEVVGNKPQACQIGTTTLTIDGRC